jgi:hypothetical protein
MSRITGDHSRRPHDQVRNLTSADNNVPPKVVDTLKKHFAEKKKGLSGAKLESFQFDAIDLKVTGNMDTSGKTTKVTGSVQFGGKTKKVGNRLGKALVADVFAASKLDVAAEVLASTPVTKASVNSAADWRRETLAALDQVMKNPRPAPGAASQRSSGLPASADSRGGARSPDQSLAQLGSPASADSRGGARSPDQSLAQLVNKAFRNSDLGNMVPRPHSPSEDSLFDGASGTYSMDDLMPPRQVLGGISPARESSPTLGGLRSDGRQTPTRPRSATPPPSPRAPLETLRAVAYNPFNAHMFGSDEALAAPIPVRALTPEQARYQTAIFRGDELSPRPSFESSQSGGDGWRPQTGQSAQQPYGWSTGASSESPLTSRDALSSGEWSGERSASATPPSSASPGARQIFSAPGGSDDGRVSPMSYRSYNSSFSSGPGDGRVSPLSEASVRSASPGYQDGRVSRLSMGRPSDVTTRSMYLQEEFGAFLRPVYLDQVIPDAASSRTSSPASYGGLSQITEESSRYAPSDVAYARAVSPHSPDLTGSEALFLAARAEGAKTSWQAVWGFHDRNFAAADTSGATRADKSAPKKLSTATRLLTGTRTWAKNLFSRR